ncbi:DUF1292 domain-containing protein [Evansella sp. AB-P1]|uniref:DUF1292 domain-containing protein n=1 Tax=Evansella sp. AB-P1 TaxID=3037653 RepID=UPI00241DCF2D|nr:DUF1292 domain-containing protein [Evansella sp. AB-P1]MDG5787067.1 DUF1292 domain-containing protein [Evansella sp. AB-P1]
METIEVGEVFTISDDNNEDQEVEVLALMTMENRNYVAVSFVEDLEDQGNEDMDVFFLKVEEDGSFSAIESDEEFNKVTHAFDEQMEEVNE